MNIADYLRATRRTKSDPTMTKRYGDIFDKILERTSFRREGVDFSVVHSLNRSCEFIVLGDRLHLVYDQYLGQSMNMMNRIFFNSFGTDDSYMYASKVAAENLYLRGLPLSAVPYAMAYREIQGKCSSYKNDTDLAKRLFYTYAQEVFILMHEVAHIMLSPEGAEQFNPIEGMDWFSREKLLDITRRRLTEVHGFMREGITQSLVEDVFRDMVRQSGSEASESDLEKLRNDERFKHYVDGLHDTIDSNYRHWTANDSTVEECACDELATLNTMGIMSEYYGVEFSESYLACLMALWHLRFLAQIEDAVLDAAPSGTAYARDTLTECMVRVDYFRWLGNNFWLPVFFDPDNKEMRTRIVSSSERYGDILDTSCIVVRERLLETETVRENSEILLSEVQSKMAWHEVKAIEAKLDSIL